MVAGVHALPRLFPHFIKEGTGRSKPLFWFVLFMIVECPSCLTQFNVPAGEIPAAGRRLRCSACKHVWHSTLPDQMFEPETPEFINRAGEGEGGEFAHILQAELDRDQVVPLLPQPAHHNDRLKKPFWRFDRDGIRGYAAALAVGFVLAGAGAYVWPEASVPAMPAVAVGDSPLSFGLATARVVDGHAVKVEAVITNDTKEDQAVPPVRVQLMDGAGMVLASWVMNAAVPELRPAETSSFTLERRFDKIADVVDVDLSFVGAMLGAAPAAAGHGESDDGKPTSDHIVPAPQAADTHH